MCENSAANYTNVAAIRQQFMRHLSATGDITTLSKKFGALRSNFERVNFVDELLQKTDICVDLKPDGKSDETAAKLRERGNEMYKIKNVKEAWKFYTKSIAYAEEKSADLGLAFANRSAVLFEINLYKECVEDINRALECNYPEHLKPKLVTRKNNCTDRCVEVSKAPHEAVPTVAAKNPKIECAGDCVEIREHATWGRFVAAARDIKAGEILAVEQPFAVLLVNQYYNHCHECITLCYNLVPCLGCSQALYCSESCRRKAFQNYHKYECPILATLRQLGLDKLKILPLKIAFSTINQQFEHSDDLYRSDSYKEINDLIANTSKRSVSDLFERAFAASIIFNLVKTHTTFFHANPSRERDFKERVLLHMQTGPSNFHEITELAFGSANACEPEEIASGAFAFLSLLNHSCCPNVTRFCYGSTIVLRAIEDIPKGEQCFDNYGYHHALMKRLERQTHLRDQYHFDCVCRACENDWGLYNDLPSYDFSQIDEKLVDKLTEGDVEAGSAILDEALGKLRDLQRRQPCKNFCQVQEIVKRCFMLFGNKRKLF